MRSTRRHKRIASYKGLAGRDILQMSLSHPTTVAVTYFRGRVESWSNDSWAACCIFFSLNLCARPCPICGETITSRSRRVWKFLCHSLVQYAITLRSAARYRYTSSSYRKPSYETKRMAIEGATTLLLIYPMNSNYTARKS